MSQAAEFRSLHRQTFPLLLPNAWDAGSAKLLEHAGARAVGTSSAALCWSLGYRDGAGLPSDELLAAVRRLRRSLSIPLSIDIEDGYSSSPQAVGELAQQLAHAGVAGINIEDGAGDPALMVAKIAAIRAVVPIDELFINARSDVYLLGLAQGQRAVELVVQRADAYAMAGADGLFVPGLASLEQIAAITSSVELPLNLMLVAGLPPLHNMALAGMRRLSTGPALFLDSYGCLDEEAARFLADGSPPSRACRLTYSSINAMFSAPA